MLSIANGVLLSANVYYVSERVLLIAKWTL